MESTALSGNIAGERRGQVFAFLTAVIFCGSGTYLVAIGKSTEGLVAIIGPLVGLLAVFFRGVRKRDAELAKKQAPAPRTK
jgi:hypothetical protein